jgi:hypothetical protein
VGRDIEPIARIPLARSVPRLITAPLLGLLGGVASAAAGAMLASGPIGVGLMVFGGLVAIGALAAAAMLLSIRLEVDESAVGLLWPGGSRVYPLSHGPVTRVRLTGPAASRIDARRGMLGWAIGPATLRGNEAIEVIRLAPTASVIVVPTERGRLAIAPARDTDLLDALSRSARARQRLAALAAPVIPAVPEKEPQPEIAPEVAPEVQESGPVAQREYAAPPVERRVLTGIERVRLEARLEAEREAADRGEFLPAPMEPEPAVPAAPASAEQAHELRPEPPHVLGPEPPNAPIPERLEIPVAASGRRRMAVRRPRPALGLVVLPLFGAGAAWGVGLLTGRMPMPGTDLARLTTLALVMAGPATSIGAAMALAWWPRLVGVVVAGGLAASVFVARALIGP